MSTWISKRLLPALAVAFLATAATAQEGLRISPPAGYCIDREAAAGMDVVLIGRCRGVANRPPAVLTAAVGARGSGGGIAGSGKELAAFFTSEAGRAALSRNGRPETVQVLEARGWNTAFLIRLRDVGPGGTGQADSWRAVLGLGGRLVTLTASGTAAQPLDREAGLTLIQAFVKAMTTANRRASASGG